MSDPIDRQILKDDLLCGDNTEHDYCFPCKKILERIDNQPAAQPEQRWILCSERLPERKTGIPKDAVEYILRKETVSTNPYDFTANEKFIKFMDDPEIASFGRWQHANGFNTALVAVKCELDKIPDDEPERKKGKWIFYETENERYDDIKCPFCKKTYTVDAYRIDDIGFTAEDFKFCPNCGSDNRGEQDDDK